MTVSTSSAGDQTTSPAVARRGYSWLGQLGIDTAYVLVGFPLAIITFVLMVTGLSVGVGVLVLTVGLPIIVGTLHVARGVAWLERVRIRPVLHRPPAPVVYRRPAPGASWLRRLSTPLTDGQMWLDLLHGIVRFPVAVVSFVVVVTWWALPLGGLTYWYWEHWIPSVNSPDNQDLAQIFGYGATAQQRIGFYAVCGVIALVTLPFVVRLAAISEAWVAHGLLNTMAGLQAEISGLTVRAQTAQDQKAAAVSAEATALRRLERDIHDGPQQRLVRLAVDLGRARQQLDADPDAAKATMGEAIAQARETLDELRTLSRGIAPPILTDRGLAAAVAALAARSTVPVRLDVPDHLGRLSPLTEQTAYFTIAEALTNLAKHSAATTAEVTLRRSGELLSVVVTDNGRGGAHLAKGHGLAGLTDRVHSAGGTLLVHSPDGGPTTIRAEIPCPNVP